MNHCDRCSCDLGTAPFGKPNVVAHELFDCLLGLLVELQVLRSQSSYTFVDLLKAKQQKSCDEIDGLVTTLAHEHAAESFRRDKSDVEVCISELPHQ